jgi:aconitate hydratase
VPVREVAGHPIDQVCIGSCTNSSLADLMVVAEILRNRTVHPRVSLVIAPGSRQVLLMAARLGLLEIFLRAGARVLEPACGPCIGMGQAPASGAASLRSFNRNFQGRCGTPDAEVYLASPAVCAAAAVAGEIVAPEEMGPPPQIAMPASLIIDDSMIQPPLPPAQARAVEIERGPTIAPLPTRGALDEELRGPVLLKLGDNVTTDDILPAGAQILPLRSNIPALSRFAFARLDPDFVRRAQEAGGGFVVAGENYGQGSSREHAALVPMYLGVRAVLARSFARIHQANLVNFGILPLVIDEPTYAALERGQRLRVADARAGVQAGQLTIEDETTGRSFAARLEATPRQKEVLLAGGMLNYARARLGGR